MPIHRVALFVPLRKYIDVGRKKENEREDESATKETMNARKNPAGSTVIEIKKQGQGLLAARRWRTKTRPADSKKGEEDGTIQIDETKKPRKRPG